MESCAKRAVLETANSESTACGPRYDYSGDEDLVQLKECTRDAKAHLASFFFSREKIDVQVLVSVFLTYRNADPRSAKYLSITTIPTIKNIKIVYLRL